MTNHFFSNINIDYRSTILRTNYTIFFFKNCENYILQLSVIFSVYTQFIQINQSKSTTTTSSSKKASFLFLKGKTLISWSSSSLETKSTTSSL